MEKNYDKYYGKIVRIHKVNQKENVADIIGRVDMTSHLCLSLGYNTYYYNGDTLPKAVSRIKIAEMGYHIRHNLVSDTGFVNIRNIEKISILPE
jgi:hypothetical protein